MEPRVTIGGLILSGDHFPERLETRLMMGRVSAVRPGEAQGRASSSGKEGRVLGGVGRDGVLSRNSSTTGTEGSAGVLGVVVGDLANEDQVGHAEVTRQGDRGGC